MSLTRFRTQRLVAAALITGAAATLVAACNPGGTTTGPCDSGNTCGYAWTGISGYVSNAQTGAPVAGASIIVHINPARHADAYLATNAASDDSGNFSLAVVREVAVANLPPVDTLTMTIVGNFAMPGGGSRQDSATILARFGPTTQPAPTQQIALHITN